jgi:ferredoxin
MANGIPVVDNAKCTGCGACVSKCPMKVMTLL